MMDQEMRPTGGDPSAQTKHEEVERQEPQEQESEAVATAPPPYRTAPGRRLRFRT